MELWTAFLIGFIGSFHCVGMCGPIALSLPYKDVTKWRTVINTLVYNLGRVVTYSFIGLLFGFFGKGIALAGLQQWFSVGFGILLLFAAFSVFNFEKQLVSIPFLDLIFKKVRQYLSQLLIRKNTKAQTLFSVGILNGFLPCGLVYLAVVGAVGTGSILGGSLYMTLFGVGTIPLMLTVSLLGNLISLKIRKRIQKIIPIMLFTFAVLFILRGLNLDIPYISPKLIQETSDFIAPICH
jgi:sulfite exporter TauE/SafE